MPRNREPLKTSRRQLINYGARGALGLGLAASGVPLFAGQAEAVRAAPVAAPSLVGPAGANIPADPAQRTLVVLQLSGGNDGLNTVIPYTDPLYTGVGGTSLRPNVRIPTANVLPINSTLGLHPNLRPLMNYWGSGDLAVIEGVEYPAPDYSHFRSTEIWMTGDDRRVGGLGWLGHALDHLSYHPALVAVSLGVTIPQALVGMQPTDIAIGGSLRDFTYKPVGSIDPGAVTAMYDYMKTNAAHTNGVYKKLVMDSHDVAQDAMGGIARLAAAGYTPAVAYPNSGLANGLKTVAQMIHGNVGSRVLYLSTGGYDTHSNQRGAHDNLMNTFAQGVDAFWRDMTAQGHADNIVLMTFSEFGRRPAENASSGTDHGSAGVMFVMGPSISGGLYGAAPNLTGLPGGNLVVQQDFRQVYAALLQNWLGISAPDILPYGPYAPMPLFAPMPDAAPPTSRPVAPPVGGVPGDTLPTRAAATQAAPPPVGAGTPTPRAANTPLPAPVRRVG